MPDTNTPAPEAKKRSRRQSVYTFSVTIPIEAGNPDSLAAAMAILAKVKAVLRSLYKENVPVDRQRVSLPRKASR